MKKPSVLIIDDSAVIRGMLCKLVEADGRFTIAATAANGKLGVDAYNRHQPDVTVMDVEMPQMNGIEAVKAITAQHPGAKILMCSSLTRKGGKASFDALRAGASDCILKPSAEMKDSATTFREEFIRKLSLLSGILVPDAQSDGAKTDNAKSKRRPFPIIIPKPKILIIGASTGGPDALLTLFSTLSPKINIPILVTQHAPPSVTPFIAENIIKRTPFTACEVIDGMTLTPGVVHIAPGDRHLCLNPNHPSQVKLSNGPEVCFCKPSIEVMFDSVRDVVKDSILAVLLTGMGSDGAEAALRLAESNRKNLVLAQDEASSVVWGIPRGAVNNRACHAVISIDEMGAAINTIAIEGKPVTGGCL